MLKTRRDVVLAGWIAATAVAAIAAALALSGDADLYAGSPFLLGPRALAVGGCLAVLALAWRSRRALFGGAGPVGFALRGGFQVLGLALVSASAAHALGAADDFAVSVFGSVAALAAAGWTAAAILRPARLFAAPSGAAAWLDLAVTNLLSVLLLGEALVRGFALLHPSPFLWNESSVQAQLDANRLPPGQPFRGGPVNAGGFPDDEFFAAERGDFVVAVLADSFGVATPSRRHHFTSILEETLSSRLGAPGRRVAVHNFSVATIGMPEYAWLLEHEVLRTRPSLVLLCIFVGNDIRSFTEKRTPPAYFQQWTLYEVARRAVRVGAAQRAAGPAAPLAGNRVAEPLEVSLPGHEAPSFEEAAFLEIERDRTSVTCSRRCPGDRRVRRRWPLFWQALDAIHERAGSQLRVAIIPDEFQVDDALWSRLIPPEAPPDLYDRTLPQRRILAWGRERGVPVLDLLPPLADAQHRAPTYHLRDTHWNAHGHQVAGDALAVFLLATLPGVRLVLAGAHLRSASILRGGPRFARLRLAARPLRGLAAARRPAAGLLGRGSVDGAREPGDLAARLRLGQHALARGLADLALGLAQRPVGRRRIAAGDGAPQVLDGGLQRAAHLAVARAAHQGLAGALLCRFVLSQCGLPERRTRILGTLPGTVEPDSRGRTTLCAGSEVLPPRR